MMCCRVEDVGGCTLRLGPGRMMQGNGAEATLGNHAVGATTCTLWGALF